MTPMRRRCGFAILVLSLFFAAVPSRAADFDFTPTPPAPGITKITSTTAYDPARGYGFLNPPALTSTNTATPSRTFAVDLPEGNYNVSIIFGDPSAATSTTVKAESRRLMLEAVTTRPGEYKTRNFTVNLRYPAISPAREVLIDSREKGPPVVPDWDNHLTFEFLGAHIGVATLSLTPAPAAITLYLAGDSTVTDQPAEPWSTWGQMLPRFFAPGVAVADYAQSGLTLGSFEHQRRLEKILSIIKPGDYLFIQFGHNDQKDKSPGAGPFTTYKSSLKRYIDLAKQKGALPVVVTPMERRRWQGGQPQPTLADYAGAARQAASEENAPLIDLNAMSLKLYTALGPDGSTKAFVHYPANTYPGQPTALADNSHHSPYGAYELARCVVESIRTAIPTLAPHLRKDIAPFDPSTPDPFDKINIPTSPPLSPILQKPAGN